MNKSIKIHPRCKTLIYHMSYAEWNKTATDFKELKDSVVGEIRGGHADGLAALMYLHRSVQKKANPFPAGYGKTFDPNNFDSLHAKPEHTSDIAQIFSKLLNRKRK